MRESVGSVESAKGLKSSVYVGDYGVVSFREGRVQDYNSSVESGDVAGDDENPRSTGSVGGKGGERASSGFIVFDSARTEDCAGDVDLGDQPFDSAHNWLTFDLH